MVPGTLALSLLKGSRKRLCALGRGAGLGPVGWQFFSFPAWGSQESPPETCDHPLTQKHRTVTAPSCRLT